MFPNARQKRIINELAKEHGLQISQVEDMISAQFRHFLDAANQSDAEGLEFTRAGIPGVGAFIVPLNKIRQIRWRRKNG